MSPTLRENPRKILAEAMDLEGIENVEYPTYKFSGNTQIHLDNNCITIKGSPSASILSIGQVDYLSLLENIVNYNTSFNLCDQCYWSWSDRALNPADSTILTYLTNSAEELSINGEELLRINQVGEVSSDLLEDLLELNLRVSSRRSLLNELLTNSSSKYGNSIIKLISLESGLYEEVKFTVKRLQQEFELNEISDFLLHNYLNKELGILKGAQAQELFEDCEVELYEVQKKLTNAWLMNLGQSSEFREFEVNKIISNLNPYNEEIQYKVWDAKSKKFIKTLLRRWEETFTEVLNQPDFVFIANLEFNIDFEHALSLFNHLYPKVKVGKKVAFTLPVYWRDWLSLDYNHFDRSRASEYINARMAFLESDFNLGELNTLLALWEPGQESIYSNAKQAAKAVKKLG